MKQTYLINAKEYEKGITGQARNDRSFHIKKDFILKAIGIMFFASLLFTSCDTDPKALDLQVPNKYDEQYYANLRAWKQTDHTLSFGWYAAWAPLEGTKGYKESPSWGERFIGLPDSMDIVSVWTVGGGDDGHGGGNPPSNDPNSPSYSPVAYADLKYVREVKGTRFVYTVGPKMGSGNTVDTVIWRDGSKVALTHDDAGIELYGQYLVDKILDNPDVVDGLDLDFEPAGDFVQQTANFTKLVTYIGQYLGPSSNHPDKLFCIDYYSAGASLSPTFEPLINYLFRQAYSQGFTEHNATRLQNYYDQVSWLPTKKFIVTEQMSVWYENAGTPFTEVDGNTKTDDGSPMYSLEGMARWNPKQGVKGGFGGFYFDRDYYHPKGPYYNVRRCIQIAQRGY
jgi:hypothetical protein